MLPTNKNRPAFPITPYKEFFEDINRGHPFGLTKLEYLAGLAMQGLLCNHCIVTGDKNTITVQNLAISSINYADALLKQLDQ